MANPKHAGVYVSWINKENIKKIGLMRYSEQTESLKGEGKLIIRLLSDELTLTVKKDADGKEMGIIKNKYGLKTVGYFD